MGISEEELEEALMHLYKLGLVEVEYDENLEAKFVITEKGSKAIEEGQPDV